jgi:hypothetical protein
MTIEQPAEPDLAPATPRTGQTPQTGRFAALAEVLWASLPSKLVTRFPRLRGTAADGHALIVFPRTAVGSMAAVALAGLAVGSLGIGYTSVYTESLTLIGLAIAIGAFSGQFGATFVGCFAFGDFFIHRRLWSLPRAFGSGFFDRGLIGNIGRIRVPLLISYVLLWMLVVSVPRLPRLVLAGIGRARFLPPIVAFVLASGLICGLTYFLVGVWTDFTPMLIRPVFTWRSQGTTPTTAAIFPLQERGQTIQRWGLLGSIGRQALLGVMLFHRPLGDRLRALEVGFVRIYRDKAMSSKPLLQPNLGRLASAGAATIVSTFLLAGILEHWWLWILTFAVMLAVHFVRAGVLFSRQMRPVQRFMTTKPLALRLGAGWVMAQVIGQAIVTPKSYTGLAIVSLIGVVVMIILFPGIASEKGPTEPEPPDSTPGPTLTPSAVDLDQP